MAVKLGYFVYENATTGCLLSKYGNAGRHAPLTETACRIRPEPEPAFADNPVCGELLRT